MTIALLIINLLAMAVFYIHIYKKFSEKEYLTDIENEVNGLINDIEFQTEKCVTLLDDRIKKAQELIATIDKRLKVAEQDAQLQKKEVVVLEKLMDDTTEKVKSKRKSKKATVSDYSEDLKAKGTNPNQLKLNLNSKKEQVLTMYRQGFDKELISNKTGIPLGEIELIISFNE